MHGSDFSLFSLYLFGAKIATYLMTKKSADDTRRISELLVVDGIINKIKK